MRVQSVGSITHNSGRPTLQWTARTSIPMQAHDTNNVIRAACQAIGNVLVDALRRLSTLGTG